MYGYNKLKAFGCFIHGCIDGYSRKILWLETIHSNDDPFIVGTIFLDNVRDAGCPNRVRSDCGGENITLVVSRIFVVIIKINPLD